MHVLEQRAENLNQHSPNPVHPELVEGLLFLQAVIHAARRTGRCFDKLSISGIWGGGGSYLPQDALEPAHQTIGITLRHCEERNKPIQSTTHERSGLLRYARG
jgi:hypothetical protein